MLQDFGLLECFPAVSGVGLETSWSSDGEVQVLGPTWCDDLCVFFSADTAERLVKNGGVLAGLLIDLCKSHGMTPNLKRQKSEMMLSLRGKGSRHWRKVCFHEWNGRMPVICAQGVEQLHIVGTYQHLGGLLHHCGDQRRESARRMAIAHGAFNEHRRLLYKNRAFGLEKRVGLFKSLVLAKAVYGMESWILETRGERAQLHSRMMRLMRRLLPDQHDAHLSDECIIAKTEIPWPSTTMRALRLRYLSQLYRAGDVGLWSVLRCDKAWLELIRADLDWMYRQLLNSSCLKDPRLDLGQWEAIMTNHPNYWKKLVGKATLHETLQWKNEYIVEEFHKEAILELEKAKVIERTLDGERGEVYAEDTHFGCVQCKVRCKTYAGECAHMFKKHNHISYLRTSGPQCGACLKHYHTVARVQRHLRASRECREVLWGRRVRYEAGEGIGSGAIVNMELQHDGLTPVLQAEGPQPPMCQQAVPELDDAVGEEVAAVFGEMEAAEHDEIVAAVVDRMENFTVSWTELQKVLRSFSLMNLEDIAMDRGITVGELRRVFVTLLQPGTWSCFREEGRMQGGQHRDPQYWQRAVVDAYNNTDLSMRRGQSVPRFGKHRIVLHAYSGRRRPGDLQCYLDMLEVPSGMTLHVISLDVVVSERHGNIMDPDVRRYWIHAARQQWVHCFIAGPPCETWSQAREHEVHDDDDGSVKMGPRVLRTSELPWGLASLTIRELKQVIFGDVLLGFVAVMISVLFATGGSGLVEHPATPKHTHSASIWKTPLFRIFAELDGFELLWVAQGLYGAPSSKPTNLLALRLPTLRQRLHEGALTGTLPKLTSLGRDERGGFRTSKLKEYPPGLCRCFSAAIRDRVDHIPFADSMEPAQAFLDVCRELEVSLYSTRMGQDFMCNNG